MSESEPGYEHRSMRVKLDRTVTVGGRRYRPGEPIEGEVPAKHAEDFEEGRVVYAQPGPEAPGQRVKKIRHDPPVIVPREHGAGGRGQGLDKSKSAKDD